MIAVSLDQKQPGFPAHVLPVFDEGGRALSSNGTPTASSKEHIPEGKTMCSLCSRLRRGILYRVADSWVPPRSRWATTAMTCADFLLNMFFGGKLKGMPPKVQSDRGDHLIIRPWPMWPMTSPAGPDPPVPHHPLHPVRQGEPAAQAISQMLRDWQQLYPSRIENMAVALRNLVPVSHFMDTRQFDFKGAWCPNGVADADGDKAFDAEDLPAGQAGWACRRPAGVLPMPR